MDALALLCHLAADGSTTLGLLRRSGYRSLQDVLLADDEELAELLEVDETGVRRLRRQAERLEDRLGPVEAAEPPEGPEENEPPAGAPSVSHPVGRLRGPRRPPEPRACPIEDETRPPRPFGLDPPEALSRAGEGEDGEAPTPEDPGVSGPFA